MAKLTRVKLGKKASSFFDGVTRLKVSGNNVVEVTPEQEKSPKYLAALQSNWLKETDEEVTTQQEVDEEEAAVDTSKYTSYTVDQLRAYIDETYELEEEDKAAVKKMKKSELITYVEQLDKEAEEEA